MNGSFRELPRHSGRVRTTRDRKKSRERGERGERKGREERERKKREKHTSVRKIYLVEGGGEETGEASWSKS